MHAYNVNQGTYEFDNSEFDEFEGQSVRFKPESIDNLVQLTKFDKRELKLMYRGFKQLCPSGVVKEDKFKLIYAQFFPRGAETNQYARFVFNTFDVQNKQEITFTDFVIGLSVLTRGTIDDKLRWIFTLYDVNGDGVITKDELYKVISSIYDLLGKSSPPPPPTGTQLSQQQQSNLSQLGPLIFDRDRDRNRDRDRDRDANPTADGHHSASTTTPTTPAPPIGAREQTERLFRKFDINQDGIVTLDEFLESCHQDDTITRSISVFNTIL